MAFLAGGHTIPHYLTNNEKNGANIRIGWNLLSSGYNFNHLKLLTSQTAVLQPLGRMVSPNLTLFYVTPPYQSFRRRQNPSAHAHGQNNLDPSEAPEVSRLVSSRPLQFSAGLSGPVGLPRISEACRTYYQRCGSPSGNYNAGCRNRVDVRKLPGKEQLGIPTMSDHPTLCDKSVSRYPHSTTAFRCVRGRIPARREISR